LILLDRALALWTRLRVDLNPIRRAVIALVNTVLPLLKAFAIDGLERVFVTTEAKRLFAPRALDIGRQALVVLDRHRAISSGTPLGLAREVDKGFDKELLVSFDLSRFEQLDEQTLRDNVVALLMGTHRQY